MFAFYRYMCAVVTITGIYPQERSSDGLAAPAVASGGHIAQACAGSPANSLAARALLTATLH